MKHKHLFLLLLVNLLTFVSCSNDDNEPVIDSEFAPTATTDLLGLYTYEDVADSTDYMRAAFFFCENNQMVVYVDTAYSDGGEVLYSGNFTYDATTGFGTIMQNDSVELEFFADKEGFIILYDEDSKYEEYREGLWLIKQTYNWEDFNDISSNNTYEDKYGADFGCESYNPDAVLDITDIGYQPSYTNRAANFEWTVANVAQWAGTNLASSAIGAAASVAVNAIMKEMGVGMGAQLNQISLQLDQIQKQLELVLQKIETILDNQAEQEFNRHKSELNKLANTILPYFEKVMEETDSAKRSEYLKEFNNMQGTINTNTFLDNIASMTVQKMTIYDAYDKYIYGCYPWEEQGYVARENLRALDMITAFKGTVLAVLFYNERNDMTTAQAHLDKFARYLDYYNTTAVVRDNNHAVCQIPNCKIRINKKVDRRDFKTQNWLKNGVDFKSSYFESSNPYSMYWVPEMTVATLAYGNNINIPNDQYKKMGLSKDEIEKIIKFHNQPLQTILFDIAKCENPFTETEMKGKTLCIMRGNNSCNYYKEETGMYASQSELCISAYTTDNKYNLYRVGVPNIGHRNGERLWYTLFIKRKKIPVFNGWKSYNDQYLWCYPTVER